MLNIIRDLKTYIILVVLITCCSISIWSEEAEVDQIASYEELTNWIEENRQEDKSIKMQRDLIINGDMELKAKAGEELRIYTGEHSIILEESEFYFGENVYVEGRGDTGAVMKCGEYSCLFFQGGSVSATEGTALYLQEGAEIDDIYNVWSGTIEARGEGSIGIDSESGELSVKSLSIRVKGNNSIGIRHSGGSIQILYSDIEVEGENSTAILANSSKSEDLFVIAYSLLWAKGEGSKSVSAPGYRIYLDTYKVDPEIETEGETPPKFVQPIGFGEVTDILYHDKEKMYAVLGTAFEDLELPPYLRVNFETKETVETEYLWMYSPYTKVLWDKSTYDPNSSEPQVIKGTLILRHQSLAFAMPDLSATITVIPEVPGPIKMPEKVIPENNKVRMSMKIVIPEVDEIVLWGRIDKGQWVVNPENTHINYNDYPGFEELLILIKDLKESHIYEYKVEVKGGYKAGVSNIMIVSTIPGDSSGEEAPDDEDDPSEGHRGGSNREGEKVPNEERFSKSQIDALIKANKYETVFIVNGISIAVPKEELIKLNIQSGEEFIIRAEELEKDSYRIEIKVGNREIKTFSKAITIKVPYTPSANVETETLIARNEDIIKTSFYDIKEKKFVIHLKELKDIKVAKGISTVYRDTVGHWAENSIDFINARGIAEGYGNGDFGPDNYISTKEFLIMLKRLEIGSVGEKENQVEPLTREGVAVYVFEILKAENASQEQTEEVADFTDLNRVAPTHREAVRAVQRQGIMNGIGNKVFNPIGLMTRGEAAEIVERLIRAF